MISYHLVANNNEILSSFVREACFASLRFVPEKIKKETKYIVYKPNIINISKEIYTKYIVYLQKLPFFFCNTSVEEIISDGAKVTTSIPYENILSTLSAIRYLYEHKEIAINFIHLKEKEKFSLQAAFFFAHFYDGKNIIESNILGGDTGHSIFDTYDINFPQVVTKYNAAFINNINVSTPYVKTNGYPNFSIWNLFAPYKIAKEKIGNKTPKELLVYARKCDERNSRNES